VRAKRLGVSAQALALGVFLTALRRPAFVLFVERAPSLPQHREQVQRFGGLVVDPPTGLNRAALQPPGKVAAAGQKECLTSQLAPHRGKEGVGALLGRGDEQERRAEAVVLAPGLGLLVLGVAGRLLFQPPVRHRPHVQLDEGK
jgi:hypothetical protein